MSNALASAYCDSARWELSECRGHAVLGRRAVEIERGDFELRGVGALEPDVAFELLHLPRVGPNVEDAFDGRAHLLGLMVGLAFLGQHLKQHAAWRGNRLVVERDGDDVARFEIAGHAEIFELNRPRHVQRSAYA